MCDQMKVGIKIWSRLKKKKRGCAHTHGRDDQVPIYEHKRNPRQVAWTFCAYCVFVV